MRFGNARSLETHLMRIDCEPYNRRNPVVLALYMVTSRDLAQGRDVETGTIHFFTLVKAERPLDLK